MNSAVLCQKKSTHYLKIPLKSEEQIYLIFLIPALINCIVYILNFSLDVAIAIQHFRENNPLSGWLTISFIYLPAIAYFVLTVSRPDWWMSHNDRLTKGVVIWFLLQMCQLIAFPFFALYRYAALIVLSIDSMLLTGRERIKTLDLAAAPTAIELYFFLQAWFQATPQGLFQTYLFLKHTHVNQTNQSGIVQILCILMSIVIIAIQTTSFQRFESQRINGRKLPWAMWLKKYHIQELQNVEEKVPLQKVPEPNQELQCPSETKSEEEANDAHIHLDRQISITPPLPPKNVQIVPPPTPLRGITTVTPLPVPDLPAPPRPDSMVTNSEQEENNDVAKAAFIEAPTNIHLKCTKNVQVPRRKYSSKGLEEDDPIGKFLSFLWWFFFILARILSIITLSEFYPIPLMIAIGIHYIAMLIYLFYYSKSCDMVSFFVNLWLGFVFIFTMIEYRIKFKYADKWLFPYFTFVMVQNVSFTLFWYFNTEWVGFWYYYAFYSIFMSMLLCISSSIVYHVLLKPNKFKIYSC